jgi:carbamoyl-phosphate synthase large subunit
MKVMVTAIGAIGTSGTIYSLRKMSMEIIGVDIKGEVANRFYCDKFFKVSKEDYVNNIAAICKKEKVDIVIPQIQNDLIPFAECKNDFLKAGIIILVSDKQAVSFANGKDNMMQLARKMKMPAPRFCPASNYSEMCDSISKVGGFPAVVKPRESGVGNFRMLVAKSYMDLQPLRDLNFPVVVMEYLTGKEYTVDVLSHKSGEPIIAIPRVRNEVRNNCSWVGTVERNDEVADMSMKFSRHIALQYAHGYQFICGEDKSPKIIECNPRIQGTMVLSTFAGANIILDSIKVACGETLSPYNIKWGMQLYRNVSGVFVYEGKKAGEM